MVCEIPHPLAENSNLSSHYFNVHVNLEGGHQSVTNKNSNQQRNNRMSGSHGMTQM